MPAQVKDFLLGDIVANDKIHIFYSAALERVCKLLSASNTFLGGRNA